MNIFTLRLCLLSGAIVLCCPESLPGQPADTLRYSRILNGNIAGFVKTWREADGTFRSYSWLNDRGRGDSLWVSWREDEKGFPIYAEARGHDYMKNPVEEVFRLEKETASWKNRAEDERRERVAGKFYLALEGAQGDLLSTLRRNGGKVKMLPSGQAELTVVREHQTAADGKPLLLSLYTISGLGFTPSYGWMDEQGRSFAQLSDWFSTIRAGYEGLRDELLAVQKAEEEQFYRRLARELPENPSVILIENVNVFDAESGRLIPGQSVLLRNGRIGYVGGTSIGEPPGARVIDGRDMTLLPGLIDMHVHYSSPDDGLFHLAAGVTSVRDLGGSFAVLEHRYKIDNGELLGPSIELLAGLIDGKGPYAGPTPALAGSAEEAVAWVDSFAHRGYRQIKIYSSIRPEWVPAVVERARGHHMRVSGHIPAFMTAGQAVEAGYDEIQHMNMLFLHFYGDTIDTRSPNRFTVPARQAASFDFDSPQAQQFIDLLKKHRVTVDPTVAIFEDMFTSRDGQPLPSLQAVMDRMPPEIQRYIKAGGGGLPVTPETDSTYRASFDAFLKMVKTLHDEGIPIVAGTDGWAGFTLHRELELYARAGIPAGQVLRLATLGAAEVLGKAGEIGSVESGKRANLILVDGDPTRDISAIRRVKMVIKDGKILEPGKVYEALSIKDYEE